MATAIMDRIDRMSITDVRKDLSKLVDKVVRTGSRVIIDRRSEEVTLLPTDQDVLAMEDLSRQIAAIIVSRLMPGAPKHLTKPQIDELASLSLSALRCLIGVEVPLNAKVRRELKAIPGTAAAIERLEKRVDVARSIAEADELGLFELAEHNSAEGKF